MTPPKNHLDGLAIQSSEKFQNVFEFPVDSYCYFFMGQMVYLKAALTKRSLHGVEHSKDSKASRSIYVGMISIGSPLK